jgi:hypothetical protein
MDLKIPLASWVLPQPAKPISKTGWLMKMNFLTKYSVAKVYLVGTVMLPMTSPRAVSKSTCSRVLVHYSNLHDSTPPS